MRQAAGGMFVLAVAGACGPSGAGTVAARWTTPADTAVIAMPATAAWCVGQRRLDLRGVVGDTGLGVALYPIDSALTPGSYEVATPDAMVQLRPGARVALRWMSKIVIQGWWGDSGVVTVSEASPGRISGEGTVWLTSGLGPDSVTALEFQFRRVRVRADTLCDAVMLPVGVPIDSSAAPDPAGVN